MRAAKRLGASGYVALAKARIAVNNEGLQCSGRCSMPCRAKLHNDPGYIFSQDPVAAPRRQDSPTPRN